MNNFEIVMGIEIHIELSTKTKMFSSASNNFEAEPNTNASFVDLGYPGTLPIVNKEAVRYAIKLAKALNMEIADELHFDRKNYFYADLPKGFQITQLENPIGKNGSIPIGNDSNITIERIQLEEDTARSNHDGDFTKLDYNRSGTPLIEIITTPTIHSKEDAVSYINQIRRTVKLLGISDAKMEEGSLRADVNISLRPRGSKELFTRVEVKNLNSLSNVAKAIDLEVNEQTRKYLKGEKIQLATKRFDEATQKNITMRVKMDETDYRFFPEPNIPVIKLDKTFIDDVSINELPWEIEKRLKDSGVDEEYINQIINDPSKLEFVNSLHGIDLSKAIKIYFAEVVSYANNQKVNLNELNINSEEFKTLINKQESGEISGSHVKKIIPLMIKTGKSVISIIEDNNFKQISDSKILGDMIDKIILNSNDFINSNKDRPERVFKFILGQLMKESRGQANPIAAQEILKTKLGA